MTAKHYRSAVVSIYPDCTQAQNALQELQSADIAPDDISLVGSENDVLQARQGTFLLPSQVLHGEERKGVALSTGIGAATGLLGSLFAFLIPGLGPIVALGPLAGMLLGAGVGMIRGGPLGAVQYEDDAIDYRELLQEGNVFVIVHCATTEEEKKAHTELDKTHPRQLHIVPYVG
jgi:hypothetical protein